MSADAAGRSGAVADRRLVDVVVVGAGFGGLATAVALQEEGADFVVLEKADDLGGVWRENVYPGAACDIPSHLYSFSYAQRKDWSRPCPMQPEVLDYLHEVAGRYGILERIETSTEVTDARFDESTARWTVETGAGESFDAGALIVACGQLSRPFTPEIEGQDSFGGTTFHSAEWDEDFDPRGKRIAVIGTGASAIQFVPELAETAARVDVYQRTPPWMLPRRNKTYAPWAKRMIERIPGLQRIRRTGMLAFCESGILGQTRVPLLRTSMRIWATWFMRRQVPDPVLRKKIWPDYPIGCKRVLFSSKYLPALGRPNVDLITAPVTRITPTGPEVDNAPLREVDAIVWGTGFKSHEFVAPMTVHGRDGHELSQRWRDGARAHLGVQVSGFPNLFLIYGPNTNLGFGSIIVMIEAQVRYVTDALRALRRSPADAFDVRLDVEARSTDEVQDRLQHSVWANCDSWYRTEEGRIVNNWPGQMAEYVQATRHVDAAEQELVRAGG